MPQAWQEQVTALPPGYKAVAPWIRGTRPGRAEPFELAGAADDVLGLLTANGVDTMALCGLSLGAVVALTVAVRAPETVSHLVLAAGQVHPPTSVMRAQKLALRMTPAARLRRVGLEKRRALGVLDEMMRLDLRAGLGSITARTLVLCGEQDRANLPAAEELAAGIPGARLEIVAGAGHELNVEQPARFNELLYGFLAE